LKNVLKYSQPKRYVPDSKKSDKYLR
jgi:hypothetical protein